MAEQTTSLSGLLSTEPKIVTAGVDLLTDALLQQAVQVTAVDWAPPPANVNAALAAVMSDPRRPEANARAVNRLTSAGAVLTDVLPARDALDLEPRTFLHAGPPITWARTSGPLRGALIGAVLYEGLAETPEEAEALLERGGITLKPCHHHRAVGPMAGVVSPSMWMFALDDLTYGGRAYCALNEGLGKVLRYGAFGEEVLGRLRWMSAVLGPTLAAAVRKHDPIDIKAIVAHMLQMGDEGHNRNRAGTSMFLRDLAPALMTVDLPSRDLAAVAAFIGGNDHFFLNLVMPACKLATDAARDIPGSTMVVTMARNGTDFGIQVSGTGDRWFTAPANTPQGLYLGPYGPEDANPDIGDSTVTETAGIGGFAMAAAPAIVRFVGGDVSTALAATRSMYEIALAEHPHFQLPIMEFRGCPTGIDVTRVVRTGILPQINTGIAGAVAGTGQVGAGLVRPPEECFTQAIAALAELA